MIVDLAAGLDGCGADGLAAQKVLQAAIDSLESETVVKISRV